MEIDSVYPISFLIVCILMTYFFVKRQGSSGCATYGFMGLIILSINMFTIFSWGFMLSTSLDLYKVMSSGKKYESKVISYTSEQRYDSEKRRHYTMYQPTVQFRTDSGEIIKTELDFSSSNINIGDSYSVNYDEDSGSVIALGFTLVIKTVGAFIFSVIFSFLFLGLVKYILGHNMDSYTALVTKVGLSFFVPFLMIGFDLLLIYAIFYGNDIPWYATAMLIFFVLVLTLAVFGYIKMLFTSGTPK